MSAIVALPASRSRDHNILKRHLTTRTLSGRDSRMERWRNMSQATRYRWRHAWLVEVRGTSQVLREVWCGACQREEASTLL